MRHRALRLATTAITAAGLCVGLTAGAATGSPSNHSETSTTTTYAVTTVLTASSLTHPVGTGTEPLSGPDDIVALGKKIFVGFQNGVGAMGMGSDRQDRRNGRRPFQQPGDRHGQ
jgi:hypothetical protein